MRAWLEAGSDGVWRLAGTLDFDSVPPLFAQTDELLAAGPVGLDLAGVEQANSAGVALLLEWRRVAQRRGVDLTLRGLPESVRRLAGLADVERLLTGEREPPNEAVP
ncbi:MAG: STAS domain-containing protein [Halofilum sp. (in: g-proteobacteria)]